MGGVGTAGVGSLIASGLSELVEHFTKGGHGDAANSWVTQGANRSIAEADLERAIGPLTLDHLTQQPASAARRSSRVSPAISPRPSTATRPRRTRFA